MMTYDKAFAKVLLETIRVREKSFYTHRITVSTVPAEACSASDSPGRHL